MSTTEQLTAALGAIAAGIAYLSLRKHTFISSALRRIAVAPSGLLSLLPDSDGKLLVVTGTVDTPNGGAIFERTGIHLGLFGFSPLSDFTLRTSPFYVPLLVKASDDLWRSTANWRVIPKGKQVTAVGIGYAKKVGIGGFETSYMMESCDDMPFFVTNLTRGEMVERLSSATKVLMWTGVVSGGVAAGIFCYFVVRNWNGMKAYAAKKKKQLELWRAYLAEEEKKE